MTLSVKRNDVPRWHRDRECNCDGMIPLCTHLIYYGAVTYVHPRREVPHCGLIDANPPSILAESLCCRYRPSALLSKDVFNKLPVTGPMFLGDAPPLSVYW